jgi:hypothetical protein
MTGQPIRAFCSYASKDDTYRRELQIRMAMLERQSLVTMWHFRKLEPGVEWDAEIRKQLAESQLILLLVSPDFLNSRYSWEEEVQPALKRHDEGSARVVPIILRPCDWKHEPLHKLEALPTDGKPITRWSDADEAWQNVIDGLRIVCTSLQSRPLASEVGLGADARTPVSVMQRLRSRAVPAVLATLVIAALLTPLLRWHPWGNQEQLPPRPSEGRLIIDARPWAYIESVTEPNGHAVVTNAETPLNIPVPEGRYTVALRGPNNDLRTAPTYVRTDTPGRVTEDFPVPSTQAYRAAVERQE